MVRNSTALNLRVDPRIIIALTALVAVLFYLMISALTFRVGFPLDDAWIHLTYARNFAEHGEWAFRIGEQSAGSTAPFWTFLLGIGFFLKLAPYIWTYFLGWLILTLLGIQAEDLVQQSVHSYRPRLPWVGLFFVTVWHLTWSAVSGMETLLHGYLIFIVLSMLLCGSRRYLALGLLAGLSVWVRPDGLTLLGPILFTALLAEKSAKQRNDALLKVLIGFGALFGPYLLFNLAIAGSPMPNTFYAKQAEYQDAWLALPFLTRFGNYLTPILASPFLVLIPGVILWLTRAIRTRSWGGIAGVIWFIGYLAIYFMRLPAYQHGRYIIPAFPILYLWGMLGMIEFVSSAKADSRLVFLWNTLLGVLCVLFTYVAASQNASDVAWIESEMVDTAKWVQANIPSDALLAVHDIGAIGYFDQHAIVDLAGLVSPDVVPFIRDQSQLAAYLDQRGVKYLITLPSFYPQLVDGRDLIFPVDGSCVVEGEIENMCVYLWK
jgi:hypothetical protein